MKPQIKGWLMTNALAGAFFLAVKGYEDELGRILTATERGALLDIIAQKMPQERLEAYLQDKKALFIEAKKEVK